VPPTIEDYSFGSIRIDGRTYSADLIVLPDRVVPNWWRREGHNLVPEDLADVLAAPPQTLVVGTGSPGMMKVPPATREALLALGIEVIVEPTSQAIQTYNRISSESTAAACLHLTC
jgi:hypothetical protein